MVGKQTACCNCCASNVKHKIHLPVCSCVPLVRHCKIERKVTSEVSAQTWWSSVVVQSFTTSWDTSHELLLEKHGKVTLLSADHRSWCEKHEQHWLPMEYVKCGGLSTRRQLWCHAICCRNMFYQISYPQKLTLSLILPRVASEETWIKEHNWWPRVPQRYGLHLLEVMVVRWPVNV